MAAATMNSGITPEYLQKRNIEMIRGDTFAMFVRMNMDGTPYVLPASAIVTFAVFGADNQAVLSKTYGSADQDSECYTAIQLAPEETAALSPSRGYRYEVEYFIDSNTVYTVLTGGVTVIPDKITAGLRQGDGE